MRDATSGEVSRGEASSSATDGAAPYSSASAAAGAAGAAAASTAIAAAAAAGGEPVKRQKGRFKLRDLGEVPLSSQPAAGSAAVPPAGGQAHPSQQSQTTGQQPGTVLDTSTNATVAAPATPATAAVEHPVSSGGSMVSTVTAAAVAPFDIQATMILLVDQNRHLLEKLATIAPEPPASAAGPGASAAHADGPASGLPSAAATGAGVLSSSSQMQTLTSATDNRQPFANNVALPGVDRGRTSSMTALTLQTPLPPKPPTSHGGTSADRNVSPLMRETPAGWWGGQQGGQQGIAGGVQSSGGGGQGQGGQPPRRPLSAGIGNRNTAESTLIGGSAGGAVGGSQGPGGGGGGSGAGSIGGGSATSTPVRARDDGTGRRAERGRLSTLLDQLKDEIEFHAMSKRDTDLELKRVGIVVQLVNLRLCVWLFVCF